MNEQVNNNSVMPTPPVGKSGGSKLLIVFMSLVIVALIGVIVFLLLNGKDKGESNTNNNNNNNSNQQENNNNAVSLKALEFAGIPCGGTDFTFEKKTVTVNEISNKEKLGMLATILLDSVDLAKIEPGVETEIDINIMELAKKYFDITPEMEKQMAEGFSTSFYIFRYKNNKSYIEIIIGGCTAPINEGDYVKFKESRIKGNTLINSYYYYYLKNDDLENNNDPVFTDSYFKDKNSPTPIYSKIKLEEANYLDFEKFDTYDMYYDISNGNLKLTKIVYNAK